MNNLKTNWNLKLKIISKFSADCHLHQQENSCMAPEWNSFLDDVQGALGGQEVDDYDGDGDDGGLYDDDQEDVAGEGGDHFSSKGFYFRLLSNWCPIKFFFKLKGDKKHFYFCCMT